MSSFWGCSIWTKLCAVCVPVTHSGSCCVHFVGICVNSLSNTLDMNHNRCFLWIQSISHRWIALLFRCKPKAKKEEHRQLIFTKTFTIIKLNYSKTNVHILFIINGSFDAMQIFWGPSSWLEIKHSLDTILFIHNFHGAILFNPHFTDNYIMNTAIDISPCIGFAPFWQFNGDNSFWLDLHAFAPKF